MKYSCCCFITSTICLRRKYVEDLFRSARPKFTNQRSGDVGVQDAGQLARRSQRNGLLRDRWGQRGDRGDSAAAGLSHNAILCVIYFQHRVSGFPVR